MSKSGNQMGKQRARQFVAEYLSKNSCVDCGENDINVLTFDHVRGKKKDNVTSMVREGLSIKTIALEIAKTEVVCFNCHMRREQKRRAIVVLEGSRSHKNHWQNKLRKITRSQGYFLFKNISVL